MLMVKAGAPVDELMAQLIPYLSPGDVIIDGGNSDFHDTERRVKEMEAHGMYFVGTESPEGRSVPCTDLP